MMTPARLRFLRYLAQHGETAWGRLPFPGPATTNRTWRPLADGGLINAEFKKTNWRDRSDWHFAITDAGRSALDEAAKP